ncbi:DUF1493 family protein [Serratia plymuthica]|uniref:DUF1493 family protein n=1 Tax=Serratia plymuthica TaxID=82996 RepID=UPI001F533A22|nr:DUF1493 family protein [Serratia plymuthica]UNK27129.1 DUF1493 family protein [Serratia plymuthica]
MNLGDNLSEYVIAFVQQELFGTQKPPFTIDENFPINVGEYPIDSEDADELLVAFAEKFHVDFKSMEWNDYFPRVGIPFIPNCLLPKYLQTDHNNPKPLTIAMLIDSAKAGRWLYD